MYDSTPQQEVYFLKNSILGMKMLMSFFQVRGLKYSNVTRYIQMPVNAVQSISNLLKFT